MPSMTRSATATPPLSRRRTLPPFRTRQTAKAAACSYRAPCGRPTHAQRTAAPAGPRLSSRSRAAPPGYDSQTQPRLAGCPIQTSHFNSAPLRRSSAADGRRLHTAILETSTSHEAPCKLSTEAEIHPTRPVGQSKRALQTLPLPPSSLANDSPSPQLTHRDRRAPPRSHALGGRSLITTPYQREHKGRRAPPRMELVLRLTEKEKRYTRAVNIHMFGEFETAPPPCRSAQVAP